MKTIAKPERTVDPTFEPVTLTEAKRQLALADSANQWDATLRSLITQAREQFEYDTSFVCCTSTWAEKLDEWPECQFLILQRRPVASVSSITYLDTSGASQTWSSSNYTLDNNRTIPTIFLTYDATFPALRTIENAVTITYVAGKALADISQQVKFAVLANVTHAFGVIAGDSGLAEQGRMAYERLVNRFERASYP